MEEAKVANAVSYVEGEYSPILILHGTKDRTVFCQESVNLYEALKKAGKDVTFYLVRNADHGGAAFWTEQCVDLYDNFIKKCMK